MNPLQSWRKRSQRRVEQEREAIQNENTHRRIEAQWPEVVEVSAWARTTRERNHLTDLFLTNLRGGRP